MNASFLYRKFLISGDVYSKWVAPQNHPDIATVLGDAKLGQVAWPRPNSVLDDRFSVLVETNSEHYDVELSHQSFNIVKRRVVFQTQTSLVG